METPSRPSVPETSQPETETTPSVVSELPPRRPSGRSGGVALIIVALLAGLAGGIAAPYIAAHFGFDRIGQRSDGLVETKTEAGETKLMAPGDESVVELVEKQSPAVVSIIITQDVPLVRRSFGNPFFLDPFEQMMPEGQSGATERRQVGSGSGFLVSENGLIITNKHVVSATSAEYTVIMNDGQEYQATILARSPTIDIAVLKIEGSGFPFLRLGDSDALRVGETAVAIGNPLGEFANSVSRGIISGLKRSVDAGSGYGDSERLTGIIQTDAAINPGNSGGPLFTLDGEVVGVNVAMAQGAENIAFALPINPVKKIIEQVQATGKISTPYLGVRYVLLTEDIQKENNLPVSEGALVLRGQNMTDFAVIPGSPADKAGIVENDIIIDINGQKIDEDHPLATIISGFSVGDEITLKVWHKGEMKEVKVRLEERI